MHIFIQGHFIHSQIQMESKTKKKKTPVLMDVLAFFMDCAKTSRLSTGVDCDDAASVTALCQ